MKPSKKFHLSLCFINVLVFLSAFAFGQGEEKLKNMFVEANLIFCLRNTRMPCRFIRGFCKPILKIST